MSGRTRMRGAIAGVVATALLLGLAGCSAPDPSRRTSCPAPLGDALGAARATVSSGLAAAAAAADDASAWLDANEYLFGEMPEYAAVGAALTSLGTARETGIRMTESGPPTPALLALSCGRAGGSPEAGELEACRAALVAAQHAATAKAAEVRAQWSAERQAQLTLAAGFTSRPTPARFDVVAAAPDDVTAVLLAHHAASFTGLNYVMMRWSMGGRTFPGVGGLVRFSGSLNGLYRVTQLLGQFSKADKSSQGPFIQAINGVAFGAYDAAFQTSWNGNEATLRVWVLMRIGD